MSTFFDAPCIYSWANGKYKFYAINLYERVYSTDYENSVAIKTNARADKKQDFHECYCRNIYCIVSRKVKRKS
jgi:hypothetical protein